MPVNECIGSLTKRYLFYVVGCMLALVLLMKIIHNQDPQTNSLAEAKDLTKVSYAKPNTIKLAETKELPKASNAATNIRNKPDAKATKPNPSGAASKSPNVTDLAYLYKIQKDCGELCDTNRRGKPGLFYEQMKANVDCDAIFRNSKIDAGHNKTVSPKYIPEELVKHYSMNGRIPIINWYFSQTYLNKNAATPVWTKEHVESLVAQAQKGTLVGGYGVKETNALRDRLKYTPGVKNGRVMVIGSERPWAEACLLEAGAREVVTLEYGRIVSKHPAIKTLIPSEFRNQYLDNTLGLFDAVVTFSSLEHSGLGRYGDALNPWGDILAVARAWCVTKTNGGLAIAVEYAPNNEHCAFNAGRFYGKIRYPYLTTNWKQLSAGNGTQRVFVLQKTYTYHNK